MIFLYVVFQASAGYQYVDPYYGGVIATYGGQAMVRDYMLFILAYFEKVFSMLYLICMFVCMHVFLVFRFALR